MLDCGCGCENQICCPGRCHPYVNDLCPSCTGAPGENPLPLQLNVDIVSDSPFGCWSMSGVIDLIDCYTYGGTLYGDCEYCCPDDANNTCTREFCVQVIVTCGVAGWLIAFDFCEPPDPVPIAIPPDIVMVQSSCDPLSITGEGCFDPALICNDPGPGLPPPPPTIHPEICLTITVSE